MVLPRRHRSEEQKFVHEMDHNFEEDSVAQRERVPDDRADAVISPDKDRRYTFGVWGD